MPAILRKRGKGKMVGNLDIEQLKSWERKELQALAKDLGVSASGKNEEIISRIVAVNVDIPEESKLTPEEKAKAEEAAKQQIKDTVKVECIQTYKDLILHRIVKVGERLEVTVERAAHLLELKLVKKC